jgi:putative spermidine/putrescine transport system ATP-binding protein
VAVFNDGKIIQVDDPVTLYERPKTRFVADFVGSSNVLPPEFASRHGLAAAWASLRPERIRAEPAGAKTKASEGYADGTVTTVHYQGSVTRLTVEAEGLELCAAVPAGGRRFGEGEPVRLVWAKDAIHLMDGA